MGAGIEQVIGEVERMCVGFLAPDQMRQVTGVLGVALRDCTISNAETAISTEFAISNDEYVRRFLALKMVKGRTERTIRLHVMKWM